MGRVFSRMMGRMGRRNKVDGPRVIGMGGGGYRERLIGSIEGRLISSQGQNSSIPFPSLQFRKKKRVSHHFLIKMNH